MGKHALGVSRRLTQAARSRLLTRSHQRRCRRTGSAAAASTASISSVAPEPQPHPPSVKAAGAEAPLELEALELCDPAADAVPLVPLAEELECPLLDECVDPMEPLVEPDVCPPLVEAPALPPEVELPCDDESEAPALLAVDAEWDVPVDALEPLLAALGEPAVAAPEDEEWEELLELLAAIEDELAELVELLEDELLEDKLLDDALLDAELEDELMEDELLDDALLDAELEDELLDDELLAQLST